MITVQLISTMIPQYPLDPDFPAKRHVVPLCIAFPNKIGFSSCIIAPGLEIREATQADTDRLSELNKIWASTLTMMQVVPLVHLSHVIYIDEQIYGRHVEQKITDAFGEHSDPQ